MSNFNIPISNFPISLSVQLFVFIIITFLLLLMDDPAHLQ